MTNTMKEKLQHNGAMQKFNKGLSLIEEEVDIAMRGEFCTQTDVDYLVQGFLLIKEFKAEMDKVLKEC